ncbi:hypothetical protein E2C01_091008 [Portunus trituberculatus]|uniref:Uncharacterized protein n=1 Tax=Portunus trituberculatus TaxID=210409 RepID=A0A5B7JI28_PORTR|nr:hypothetical protein [Portunus trituberculatus]
MGAPSTQEENAACEVKSRAREAGRESGDSRRVGAEMKGQNAPRRLITSLAGRRAAEPRTSPNTHNA